MDMVNLAITAAAMSIKALATLVKSIDVIGHHLTSLFLGCSDWGRIRWILRGTISGIVKNDSIL